MGWPFYIGRDGELHDWTSLEPSAGWELIWLDWSVDPADMEEPERCPTPGSMQRGGGDIEHGREINGLSVIAKESGVKYGMNIQTFVKLRPSTGPIPRIATGVKDRVNRLKALGNGQVPQCVKAVWELLGE